MPPAKPGKNTLPRDSYHLIIRQAPKAGKSFSGKEKDRKPIDPPPIVQLYINDASDPAHPYFMCVCALWHEKEDRPADDPVLAGTVVSSLHRLKDTNNADGGFFVFPDLSARAEGDFRLKFTLWELKEGLTESLQTVNSRPFTVYPAKTFPGLAESTFLTRSFSDQGVRLRIRKETRTSIKRSVSESENGPYQHEGAIAPPGPYGQPNPYGHPGFQGEYGAMPKRQKSAGGQGYPDREQWAYTQPQSSPASYQPVSAYYQEGIPGSTPMEFPYRGPPVGENAMAQHGYWSRAHMNEYSQVPQVPYGTQARSDGTNGMSYGEATYAGMTGAGHGSTMSSGGVRESEAQQSHGHDPNGRAAYRYGSQAGTAVPPNTLPPITASAQPVGQPITSPPAYSAYAPDGRYQQGGNRASFNYTGAYAT